MLSTHHLTITVPGRTLLDAVSMSVHPGELLCIIGPNGAGKTTLLRSLAGEIDAARDQVRLAGRLLRDMSPIECARVRAVYAQHQRSDLDFAAIDVVLLGRFPQHGGRPGRDDRAIALAAMTLTGSLELAHRPCATLSGGEQARVHLARALAQLWTAPEGGQALLLDEPAAALDPHWQHRVLHVAREFARQRGCAVMAIVHDLNLAARYADRMLLLDHGRVLAEGEPEQVLRSPCLASAFGLRCRLINDAGSGRPVLLTEAAF